MFKKTWFLLSLMASSIFVSSFAMNQRTQDDAKSYYLFNLALGVVLTGMNQGVADATSIFSQEMNGLLLLALLSKTSLKNYSVPLVFTALHGRQMIKFGVGAFKDALGFRATYKKYYGKTDGWMSMYAKRFIPSTIKRGVVGLGMRGVSKAARACGIDYPEWVRNNFWLMGFAMQGTNMVKESIATMYDFGVNFLFA